MFTIQNHLYLVHNSYQDTVMLILFHSFDLIIQG
ncbi:hypothetical protein [Enterocloster phage PMBT24]|uniref:Uncharacterized protein n=1 Tax=Enterocloster phage PMBT24 TaxID=3025413 RepID=A0AAT9TVX5_9CAUD|nr:hypothetical protein [Enterocloster phage PMBT24]